MASDEFQIQIKIDMAMAPSRTLKLVVKSNFWIQRVKKMIEDKEGIPQAESILYKQGVRLELDSAYTLEDYKTMPDDLFYAVPRLRGGAPKGVRKVTKQERLHKARASAQYSVTQYTLCDGMNQVCQNIAQADYIPMRLATMTLPQLEQLNEDCKDIVRNDRVAPAIIKHLVPELKALEEQQEKIKNSIQALKECFDISMIENFFNNYMDTEPFYEELESRLNTAREAARQEAERVRMEALQAQLASANDDKQPTTTRTTTIFTYYLFMTMQAQFAAQGQAPPQDAAMGN